MTGGYIYSTEIFCLFLDILLIYFHIYCRGRKTELSKINFYTLQLGFLYFTLEIILDIYTRIFPISRIFMNIWCLAFFVNYTLIMAMIVVYINRIKTIAFLNSRKYMVIYILVGCTMALVFECLLNLGFVYRIVDGKLHFNSFVHSCTAFGILAAITSLIQAISHYKDYPKPVLACILIFVPLDLLLFMVQNFWNPSKFMMGVTFVVPLTAFYVMFHTSPIDQYTGCLGEQSFQSFFEKKKVKKSYSIAYITLPKLKRMEDLNHVHSMKEVQSLFNSICREVEYIKGVRNIYRIGEVSFAVTIETDNEQQIADTLTRILDTYEQRACWSDCYRMVVFHRDERNSSYVKVNSFIRFLLEKIQPEQKRYVADCADYDDFQNRYALQQLLIEIRNNDNLDDPHVVVYAQPIFDVKTKTFRTAEALMRMQVDGKMIFPDQFIPVAEQNGCIHTLTKIILHKVCLAIKELEKDYNLDAITVNCSSGELTEYDMYHEIMKILKEDGADSSKIRLEITESMSIDNTQDVKRAVCSLNQAGILFYLDDFGTGYSNLERIMSYPFYTIKFDKSLLYRAMEDPDMADMMRYMISTFRKKNFHCLVEGVEEESHMHFCTDIGFEFLQGYFYSRPVPIEQMCNFFTKKA